MKRIFTCLLILVAVSGCKKEVLTPVIHEPISAIVINKSFADSAFQFVKDRVSETDFNRLDQESFQILRIKNTNIGIKIYEKGMKDEHFILLQKTGDNFTGHRISILGIGTSKQHSGNILFETLERKFIKKYIVENNRVTGQQLTPNTGISFRCDPPVPEPDATLNKNIRQNLRNCVMPEVAIIGYVRMSAVNFYSLFWLMGGGGSSHSNYTPLFYSYYTPSNEYLEGGGSGNNDQNNGAVSAPPHYSPDKPVTDVKNEVKCFTDNSSIYTITININQPVPGIREVFEPLSNFPVGHTFLTLRQVNSDGSEIIRNLGFYPKTSVKPGSTRDFPTFGDDSETPFDVSLKLDVSAGEFMTVVANLGIQQTMMYDLDNFNCTTSAISALKSINIQLPETRSNNILFNGLNPADLGEDIKALNLDNFSAKNGGRKVARTVSNDNSQKAPAKKGGC